MHGELLYLQAAPGTMLGERLCVPSGKSRSQVETLRYELIRDAHDNALTCHTGTTRTYQHLKRRVYWPGMKREIDEYVAACPE